MFVLNSPQVVQETIRRWKTEEKIAFVPTMGCLHEGHLTLVRAAKSLASKVVVSIFVNPLQFGPNEDFSKYPRTFEEDVALLEKEGVDLLFHPNVSDLYPEGFSTHLSLGSVTERLCGKFRPGHFNGVATVCLKLFNITMCDVALFGEKDFQQVRVIEQMIRDLNLPVGLVAVPTVRDEEGLALSSRNRYLNEEERKLALCISKALFEAREKALQNPFIKVEDLLNETRKILEVPGMRLQYLEVTKGRLLEPTLGQEQIRDLSHPHLLTAVFLGSTRLIDNISLNGGKL